MTALGTRLKEHLFASRRLARLAAAEAGRLTIAELREAERMIDEIGWAMEAVLESVSEAMEGTAGEPAGCAEHGPESALLASLPRRTWRPDTSTHLGSSHGPMPPTFGME